MGNFDLCMDCGEKNCLDLEEIDKMSPGAKQGRMHMATDTSPAKMSKKWVYLGGGLAF